MEAVVRTIEHPDSDVSAVVSRAQTIARRALDGEIRDVLRYATKALFAVSRKQKLKQDDRTTSEPPNVIISLAGPATNGSAAAIEARIILDQLLNALPQLERDVFVRHTMGWKHARIAKDLGISAPMSSYYLLRAKARLDRHVSGQRSETGNA